VKDLVLVREVDRRALDDDRQRRIELLLALLDHGVVLRHRRLARHVLEVDHDALPVGLRPALLLDGDRTAHAAGARLAACIRGQQREGDEDHDRSHRRS
jgi:hypothetical protein